MKKNITLKITYSALCIALAIVLPFLTAQLRELGNALCPMHLPIFLCGFICGWQYGLAAGLASPLLRSLFFGMPPLIPLAIGMACELATYGAVTGFLYKKVKRNLITKYICLICAMLAGRIVWGCARYILSQLTKTPFTIEMFLAKGFTEALPGIAVQLIFIPILVKALEKAKIIE